MKTYNARLNIKENRNRMMEQYGDVCERCGEITEDIVSNIPKLISHYSSLCYFCRKEEGLED